MSESARATSNVAGTGYRPPLLLLALEVVFMLAMAVTAWQATTTARVMEEVASHETALLAIGNVGELVHKQIAAHRGFLISGTEDYLQLRANATGELRSALSVLGNSFRNKSAQYQRVREIDNLVLQRIAFQEQTLALYKKNGNEAAVRLFSTPDARHTVAHIRALIEIMRDEEDRALQAYRQGATRDTAVLRIMFISLALYGGALLAFVFTRMARELWQRHAGAKQTRKLNLRLLEPGGAMLRQRTALLYARSLIEASLDPLVTISAEGKIMDVNRATENATGRSRTELIGSDFSEYFTEPEVARVGYQTVFSRGEVKDYPLALRHRDGHVIDVLYNASVYRDEDGNVSGIFAAARDITERKRAEQQQRTALLYARSLIEASLDPLVTISAEGKIMDVNRATENATGRSRTELIGSDFSEYFTEPEVARVGYQTVFSRGEVKDYPLALRHRDGHVIDVLYNASVYRDEDGNVSGIFAAARDITERKRSEALLRQAHDELERRVQERTRELSEANESLQEAYRKLQHSQEVMVQQEKLAAMGTLVGGMAHEVNNPLMGIIGYISSVRDNLEEGRPRAMLDKALHEVERISRLVKSMLVFGRHATTEQRHADLRAVLERVIEITKGDMLAAGVRVCNDLPERLPVLSINEDSLQQVMLNLLLNARDSLKSHDAPGREIHVAARALDEEAAEFVVYDNGHGVAEPIRTRIFDPFFTTKPPGSGTGLGLAVSRQMMEAAGGSIGLDVSHMDGACFVLRLKRCTKEES